MAKEQGNEQFKLKNFEKAIEFYTQAIEETPNDHTIYGNRSASYHNLRNFDQALEDAEKCIQMKPDWSKGYQRKGQALHGKGMLIEAMDAYEKGLELEPNNQQILQGMNAVDKDASAQFNAKKSGGMGGGMGGGAPGGGMNNMFGGPQAEAKLRANPRIAKYFEDPKFRSMWEMC